MTRRNISWSEVSTYRQCPHKHQLVYIDRWREPEPGRALRRGILWHELLEMWFLKRSKQGTSANRKLLAQMAQHIEAWGNPTDDQDDETRHLMSWMLAGYLERWGLDPEWEVVGVEQWVEAPLGDDFLVRGKIDLLVKIRGHLWVVDHKTASNMPNGREYDLDDQFGLYTWLLRQNGQKVLGCVYDVALTRQNKKTPQTLESRFQRHLLQRTDRELNAIATEVNETMTLAWRGVEPGKAVNRPRHPDADTCRWKCAALQACIAGRRGRDEYSFLQSAGFVQDDQRANLLILPRRKP